MASMTEPLSALFGQEVEVVYLGILYRGRLMGATESELDLLTDQQRLSLPMEGVLEVRKKA